MKPHRVCNVQYPPPSSVAFVAVPRFVMDGEVVRANIVRVDGTAETVQHDVPASEAKERIRLLRFASRAALN